MCFYTFRVLIYCLALLIKKSKQVKKKMLMPLSPKLRFYSQINHFKTRHSLIWCLFKRKKSKDLQKFLNQSKHFGYYKNYHLSSNWS